MTRLDEPDIARVHAAHWREGLGTVSVAELMHFRDLIAEHRPRRFIEIGMASGLTAGILALLLDAHGGELLVTVDHDNVFFGDPTKENGYLIPEIYTGSAVEVVRLPHTTALDVPARGTTFEMGFIDANHQHPWPLIDTLCLYPVLEGPRVVLHDDLNLYRHQPTGRGVGPKHLFDQVPPEHRHRYAANHGNVFSIDLTMDRATLERMAMDGFALPWTLTSRLQGERLEQLRGVLDEHYSPRLREMFERSREKYNHPSGRHYLGPAQRSQGAATGK